MHRLPPIVLVLLALPCVAAAQTVSPGFGGYYRPGRAAAVEARGSGEGRFSVDGAVPTIVTGTPAGELVPLLTVRPLAGDEWRPLGEDERLVVGAPLPADVATAVYPGRRVVQVHAPPVHRAGPAAAWSGVDAYVSATPPDAARRAALLAAGVTLVLVNPATPPDDGWPWQRVGGAWALRPPVDAMPTVVPEAFDALDPGPVGMPVVLRRSTVLAAVLVAVVLIAAALVRGRAGTVAVTVACVAATAGVAAWAGQVRPVEEVRATVLVLENGMAAGDAWRLAASPKPVDHAADGQPVFRSADVPVGAALVVDGQTVRYRAKVAPRRPVVTVTRAVTPGTPPVGPLPPVRGRLRSLADVYLRPGDRVLGVSAGTNDADLGTVVIERRRPH